MRPLIRFFFRTLRRVLTPIMLIFERLSTPTPLTRSQQAQAEVDEACQALALYQFRTCPFCIKVRKQMARLGLDIEKRDAQHVSEHRQALLEQGGAVKVPCLCIRETDGADQWLYESDDINRYLDDRFGEK